MSGSQVVIVPLSPIPDFPTLAKRASGEYNGMAYAWATHMGGVLRPELNAMAAGMQEAALLATGASGTAQAAASQAMAAASSAQSNAHFLGAWDALTGALALPASVEHAGDVWQLLRAVADVTDEEPGVSDAWRSATGDTAQEVAGDWDDVPLGNRVFAGEDMDHAPAPAGESRIFVRQVYDAVSGTVVQTANPTADPVGWTAERFKLAGEWTPWRIVSTHVERVIDVDGGSIKPALGNRFVEAVSANRTFTFDTTGWLLDDAELDAGFQLEVKHTGGVITWPSAVKWSRSSAPSLTTNRRHVLYFVLSSDRTVWYGAYLNDYPL